MGGMGGVPSWGGPLPPKLSLNRLLGAVVVDDELDRVARLVLRDPVAQFVDGGDRNAVRRDDDVAAERPGDAVDDVPAPRALESRLRRAAARLDVRHEHSALRREVEEQRDARVQRLSRDAEDGVLRMAALDDLGDDAAHRVARDGEADAEVALLTGIAGRDLRIDADHLAARVEQRAA